MSSLFEQNFEVAAKLETLAATKIMAMLRCMEDNSDDRIKLRDPEVGGNSVHYDWQTDPGPSLVGCCEMREVRLSGDKLTA